MIRSFIALELENIATKKEIQEFTTRLKKNQNKFKVVKRDNLHLTIKFLGNINESLAPKIYKIVEEVNDKFFNGENREFHLIGVGQFNKYSVIWAKLKGDINFLQSIKDTTENLLNERLKIERDKRPAFKPHLTIGRLNKKRINYKTFETFKNLIKNNKDLEFGSFNIHKLKFKKSELTPNGPIYSDLVY